MKRRFSLFTYPVMDIKAAEAELNRRAAAGWRLERIWLDGLACFVPAEEPVCYCLDWCDPILAVDAPDYRALLAEAGWTRRALVGNWAVYEAPAGATPIQTDSTLEYQRFRRKVLRRMGIVAWVVGILLLLVLLLLTPPPNLPIPTAALFPPLTWCVLVEILAGSNVSALLTPLLPLALAGAVLWLGRMVLRLCQWKRAAREGEPFPVPGRVSAGAAKLGILLVWLWLALWPAALCLDILDDRVNLGWAIGTAIGGFLSLRIYRHMDEELRRRNRRLAWGALALAAAVVVVPWLVPDGLTDPLYPDRPLAEARLLEGEDTWCIQHQDEASLLVSCTRWEEGAADCSAWLEGRCWHIRGAFLADRVTAEYLEELGPENQAPLPGYDQVWTAPEALYYANGNTADLWLLRRGSVIVRLETTPGLLEEQDLDNILTQLEGGA